jgi:hypothetical protein
MTYKHKITGTQAKLAEDGKYYIHNCSIGIPKQFIEDSKVWLKQDGFEILSFYSGYEGAPFAYIFEKLPNGLYSKGTGDCTLEYGLTYWEIFSVKRISDGEVFSMFDKIYFKGLFGNNSEHKYDTIKGFDFKQDGTLGILYHNGIIGLDKVEKYKEPILVTKDGVELFGCESIYGVTDDFQLCHTSLATEENVKEVRVFAKKENAEKYIKENKPQYSLNDIRNVLTKQMKDIHWIMINVDKVIKDLEK